MTTDEFIESMKVKASKRLLEVSGTGKLSQRTWTFPKGHSELMIVRGGAIEKAAIHHLKLQGITQSSIPGEVEHVVYQMEVFPENPYCPMGHFNTEWSIKEPRLYYMNLDLFPAVRVEEDLRLMKAAMDTVADRFGRNREEMKLKDEDFEFFVTAYERFLDTYLDIISKRKGITCTESEMRLKLERNGKWLEYLMFKDRAIQASRDILPLELLVEMSFPPVAIF
jgi:coproporphyrinogen III oxidase